MATTDRKPLTAYQKRLRKDLGLEEEATPDQQLARLEVDIRRLKVEFDIFFNGGVKSPPYDTRNRIETAFSRLGDDRSLTFAQRYKYNSLASRFAAFRDLWRRSMQSREEGRDFITVARAKLETMRQAADAEIAARNGAKAAQDNATAAVPPLSTPVAVNLPAPRIEPAPISSSASAPPVTATVPKPIVAAEPAPVKAPAPVKTASSVASGSNLSAPALPEVTAPPARDRAQPTIGRIEPEADSKPTATTAGLPPVSGEKTAAKPKPASFPKILPPTSHQLNSSRPDSTRPAKYERSGDDRRAAERRAADRRALPFGRRVSDPRPRSETQDAATPVPPPMAAQPTPRPDSKPPVPEITARPAEVTPKARPLPPRAPVTAEPANRVADQELANFMFTDPRREPARVNELFAALVEAKVKCGEPTDDLSPARFGHLLAMRADKLRKSAGCENVVFSVAIERGQVNLNARAGE